MSHTDFHSSKDQFFDVQQAPRSTDMERLNKFENPQIEKSCGQLAISAGLRLLSKLEKELGHRYEPMVLPVLG